MNANATLQVERRDVGSGYSLRKLRESGRIPGVIYGQGLSAPTAISLEAKQVLAMLRTHPNAVVEVDIPGEGKHPIMITDMQRDPLSQQIVHMDFRRVDMNSKINTSVRLDFVGSSLGQQEGGMMQIIQHEIEIECYPKDIPDVIEADVNGLGLGDHLSVSDLKLPEGVTATQEPGTVIVAILAPQKGRTEEELDELHDAAAENEKHREAAVAVEKE